MNGYRHGRHQWQGMLATLGIALVLMAIVSLVDRCS